jgi:hypothetical protein
VFSVAADPGLSGVRPAVVESTPVQAKRATNVDAAGTPAVHGRTDAPPFTAAAAGAAGDRCHEPDPETPMDPS